MKWDSYQNYFRQHLQLFHFSKLQSELFKYIV